MQNAIDKFITRAKRKPEVETEANIENHCVNYAKRKGCRAFKLVMLNRRGFPDRTVLIPKGRVIFVEFKRKGGKLSPIQVTVKRLLESLGFPYYVCDNKSQFEEILDKYV